MTGNAAADHLTPGSPAGNLFRPPTALAPYSGTAADDCIGAAVGMRVEDVCPQNRRLWLRLQEKGGKQHAMPCHHNLEAYLHEYLDGAGLANELKAIAVPDLQPCDRPGHRPSPAPGECL
jgi:hypothetical protein